MEKQVLVVTLFCLGERVDTMPDFAHMAWDIKQNLSRKRDGSTSLELKRRIQANNTDLEVVSER